MLRKPVVLVFIRFRVRARHHEELQWSYTSSFTRLRSKKKPPAAGISNTEQGMSNFEG